MEEEEAPTRRTRKMKFTPKAPPPRKTPQTNSTATTPLKSGESNINEDDDEDGDAKGQRLMNMFNENLRGGVSKAEKKTTAQVAFGPGAERTTSIRKFGAPKSQSNSDSIGLGAEGSDYDDDKAPMSLSLNIAEDLSISDAVPPKVKRDYEEPWDYDRSYYPTTLPWRRPYSGDPELLDEAEFGDVASNVEYDENTINPASDLELLEKCDEEKIFLLQMPAKLPHIKRSASAKGKEKVDSSKQSEYKSGLNNLSSLKELPAGHIGKMLVYKSGAVKLKIGDVLYDVNPGAETTFAQDVMAINTEEKHCCAIGEVEKRAIVTPDVDSMLAAVTDSD